MICCLSSQKFGAQKLVYNKNNLRLLTVQKARGSRSPKNDREGKGAANLSEGSTHCVPVAWQRGGGHEQGQLVCLLCQAYALLLLALA